MAWRLGSRLWSFFEPRFEDPERELEYQKLSWYSNKPIAVYAALYLYLNWILYLILNHSVTPYEKYTYYGGLTFFTLPVPFMVIFNMPRRHPIIFQIWFTIAVWYCGLTELIQIHQCDFFDHPNNTCHGKDFLAMMYYNTALPALGLFVISKRLYNFIIQAVVFILLLVLVIPVQSIFSRNVISFAIFSVFMQGLHYTREMTDRRMYMLNSQLKVAYRAQQKAQIAESKASQAKRRFASYIFHEVRVPLNTAMLAYQNLQTSNAFRAAADSNQSVEIYAMEASLTMMQQVLNDVLDLQKMDAGRFESSPRPFNLHRAISSVVGGLGVATAAKGLDLKVETDPRLDQLAKSWHEGRDDGLWVVGDEIRLRQVLTNLTSNAVKFTPENGGSIKIVSKVIAPTSEVPTPPSPSRDVEDREDHGHPFDKEMALVEAEEGRMPRASPRDGERRLVIRLEVHDSGPGIRPSDLVDNRLFQPFVQTRVGKLSGKGSGLGLAIVRQIVHLSGGRLGVRSRKGEGAMFWVELAYSVATPEEVEAARERSAFLPSPAIRDESSMGGVPPALSAASGLPEKDGTAAVPPQPVHHPTSFGSGISRKTDTTTDSEFPPSLPPVDLKDTTPLPSLPATAPPSITSTPASPPVGPPTQAASTDADDPLYVLVVDDDGMTRTLMARMLTKLGCRIDTASDGQQALDMILGGDPKKPYDWISLDNYMPVMTGEEAVKELRARGRKDLVIGCTGTALTEDQASYIAAGADRVLAKPIMLKDLKAVLDLARQRREDRRAGREPRSPPEHPIPT
ncbi:hypothetical protein PUNSTDRAFT_119885 [Punctularia strigosozonata HHB-11173 SS5]|uniref:uncharacterized protein n=1 Tax=Punctularia strigosozonata (strain HHB-11173) TaxID=741275 RepID=UPI00044175B2|nr:uncharacterized protein PUNSTDRAFT_119885 [Punctularia strigosozonata HHB-11173 SS5]EIN11110.1 hypothetical protein PUNSTDRAFT_119885 [Punctularia strigosozonata HHB-11173 SS5]